MAADPPDVTVATVTHNGREQALATLRSARAASGGARVQWIVVDNDSRDGTPEAIEREFRDVRVLRRPNLGFAAGNNAALAHAEGRYLLLLNPDVEIRKGTLADLVRALDRRPEVGAASVIQLAPDGDVYPSAWRFPSPGRQLGEALFARRLSWLRRWQEALVDRDDYQQERDVDWVTGSFLVVRRETVAAVGRMDERFFLYAEETDWCYRIRQLGWEIRHLPVMEIVHHHAPSTRPDLFAQLSHSKVLYARKHFGRGRATAFVAALVLRHALRALLLSLRRPGAPSGRERRRAEVRALRVVVGVDPPPFREHTSARQT